MTRPSLLRLLTRQSVTPMLQDDGAVELLALMDRMRAVGVTEHTDRFVQLERQVGKALRNGSLASDFRPAADGTVSLPPVQDPLYSQAIVYWAATLREPIARIEECCRLAGDCASPDAIRAASRRIAFEDSVVRTDSLYLSGYESRSPGT